MVPMKKPARVALSPGSMLTDLVPTGLATEKLPA